MSDGYVDLDANYVKEADEPSTIPENIGALELLQMAYRGQIELSPQQARCAIESLPYDDSFVVSLCEFSSWG